MSSGLVFDVKRFALHDGDGLRTTAFLKGCPLSCPWCQNPEGIDGGTVIEWIPSRCIRCGSCVATCPRGAVLASSPGLDVSIIHERCNRCGVCVDECPTGALRFNGRRASAEELAEELIRDRGFFADKGGVTLSGGEPLAQPSFAAEVLQRCREAGVRTAVETTLAVPRASIDAVLPHVNQFIVDLKLADSQAHRGVVAGGRNERSVELEHIRRNLEYLLRTVTPTGSRVDGTRDRSDPALEDPSVLIRIPLIPGFTATRENLRSIGAYVATLRPEPAVELLNFNPLAESKYRVMGRTWPVPSGTPRYTTAEMATRADWVREAGVARVTA